MPLGAMLYVKNSTETAALYCNAFGMNTGYTARNDDGMYLHANLKKSLQENTSYVPLENFRGRHCPR